MTNTVSANSSVQQSVTEYFDSVAGYWRSIYRDHTVYGYIHQQRREIALRWIDDLHLSGSKEVLEVGCGAGLTTVALAERGFRVHATDVSSRMLQLAGDAVRRAELSRLVSLDAADAQALQFQSGSFPLVIALGVIPWLPSPELALREIVRVLAPGGYLLLNCDNRWRLHELLDPVYMPLSTSLRRRTAMLMRNLGVLGPPSHIPGVRHSPWQFDRMLASNGVRKLRSITLGFGPFSFFTKLFFSEVTRIEIHRKLQCLADRNVPVLRNTGSQYLVLARKHQCENH